MIDGLNKMKYITSDNKIEVKIYIVRYSNRIVISDISFNPIIRYMTYNILFSIRNKIYKTHLGSKFIL